MPAVIICSDFRPKKRKSVAASTFSPSICHEEMGLDAGGYDEQITDFTDETGLVSRLYRGQNGYAVEVTPIGFDNTITMMVGVDNDGTVLGISIISHTESAGLGAVAAGSNSAGRNFRQQFVGLSGSVSVTKDGGQVDAITNATITSRAICAGINAALACVAGLGGA